MTTISGKLVLPSGVTDGTLTIDGDHIAQIDTAQTTTVDDNYSGCLIVPGFIDTHMHGLGRHCTMETEEITAVAQMQPRFGTTGFLPTMASLSVERFREFGQNILASQKATSGSDSARILGAHFEGPFVNPAAKGGMNEKFLRPVDLDECRSYLEITGEAMKIMTIAPELPGSIELIQLLRRHGVVVAIGHSRATPEELAPAIDAGLGLVCHLYNAFEREGDDPEWPWRRGLLDTILQNEQLAAEVNGDMVHVRPAHVRLAIEQFGPDRFLAITDSVPGAALEPGEYEIDGRQLTTRGGVARLVASGTMVGSIATMNQVFENLVKQCDVDLVDAARFTSTNAARVLGFGEKLGSLETGKTADLAVLDKDYHCVATYIAGRKVYKK